MGKITGFMEYRREGPPHRPVAERVKDWREIEVKVSDQDLARQGARCMDCGVPFCHKGCPLGNIIPDWNDLVYRNRWREALERLHSTNNFPDFTGRICPAPCEEACVLNINDKPVTIKLIEKSIADHGWAAGWITPRLPGFRTGKRVAIVGSGPAGLACAQQLTRAGHWVTVYERSDRIGGLLMYGIPEFKLEKVNVKRRVDQLLGEGVEFITNCRVGTDIHADELRARYDAVCLTMGATKSRDLPIPGRELGGIHLAMDYLPQQTKRLFGDAIDPADSISAAGKRVIILGGGDTGSDCLGTSNRQGATSVHQFELLPMPPKVRTADMPWPDWPMIFRTSGSQEEGGTRDWSISTKSFSGVNGQVKKLHAVRLEWKQRSGRRVMEEVPGSDFELDCDLVLLALGFTGPEPEGIITELGLKLDARSNIAAKNYATNVDGVFAAGDARRGQSLVVWAIWEGRECARVCDAYLSGNTFLSTSPYP